MKHLLLILLLFCTLCRAQDTYGNYTKVTAYRLTDEYEDGPCSVLSYIQQERKTGKYIQAAESYDAKLAYSLLKYKKEAALQWTKNELKCSNKEAIPNMFVVEINKFKDTVFTTANNCSLFLPKEEAGYFDGHNSITASFTPEMAAFFDRDYKSEFANRRIDSIPYAQVLINNTPLYKKTRKSFEKAIHKFQLIKTDSVFNPDNSHKEYWLNDMQIQFDGNDGIISQLTATKVSYNFPEKYTLSINGVLLGDEEEKLYEKFPESTKYRNWGAAFNDLNDNYAYEVGLKNSFNGYVTFYIKKKRIAMIEVNF
ncbi:hypothetical protein Q765_19955 [Flavobacterium rivuli WB 3.3-2 = DSM 21788]|uniref:Uncharacterized protein n=1 Tax=Flavobacterium rivuli WB 3.3-2 = DSM 21788 TaxID=1121895 RepID=A0A0A2LZI9_9FLAO|nr:hypothetical protein [Flavobacterium rivuli]KGO84736.1 hypothetical protein Q765_19955 [Flavobacterium rivuli WB 3.3-2 = DSM 21788]